MVGDASFVHDTLLMPDYGTARCDFPGGDARQLWRTIQHILSLPDDTRLFTGHDYMPGGRAPAWESTVAEQRAHNFHLQQAQSEQEFVALREARDATLPLPKLILHALQVNIAGGQLPRLRTMASATSRYRSMLSRRPGGSSKCARESCGSAN